VRAGRLDRLITIQQLTSTRDAVFGSEVQTWSTLAQVWADVRDLSGREFVQARQTGTQITTELTIRHRTDVTPKQRVLVDGRTLEINNVLQIGRRDGLRLMCEEINGG
jgi:SPP1 family predicted phage head-tail adaptor